jgi:hypothetical protein
VSFCAACRSHFCPHVAPYLYLPPFAEEDELEQATAAWETEAQEPAGRDAHEQEATAASDPPPLVRQVDIFELLGEEPTK